MQDSKDRELLALQAESARLAEELAGGRGPWRPVGGGCLSVHGESDRPSFLQVAEILMAIQGGKKCWTCPASSRNT